MAADLFELKATDVGTLAPANERAKIKLGRLAAGEIVLASMRRPRHLGHHRKFMALAKVAFEQWNPAEASIDGMPAKKSFDVFRKELVVQAGYYEIVLGLDGAPRLEAKSLRFDAMDQDEFSEVYEAVLNVLLAGILTGVTREDAERMADAVQDGGFV